jgi:hypothetical protein
MALNSSGPISLGGATTGQSINLELGQASLTTISLNDTNVRGLAGVSSGVITMPTDFWGKSNVSYFWAIVNKDTSSGTVQDICFDSSNNYYIVYAKPSASYGIVKINSNATSILNQKTYTSSTSVWNLQGAAVSGSILTITGSKRWNAVTPARSGACIDTFDTSTLNAISSGMYYYSSSVSVNFGVIAKYPDSSGNLYFQGPSNAFITTTYKFNPTTFSLNGMGANNGQYNQSLLSCNIDRATDNIYTSYNTESPNNYWSVGKISSSFTSAWLASATVTQTECLAPPTAHNNNVYAALNRTSGAANPISVVKLDSSTGNFSSTARNFVPVGAYSMIGMTTDTSGNLYFLQRTDTGQALFKYNTSMVLQWQREIVLTNYGATNLQITPNGSLSITLMDGLSGFLKVSFFTYPTDGSITGSWSSGSYSIAISASSYTESSYTPPSLTNYSYVSTSLSSQPNVSITQGTCSATLTKVSI